MMTKGWNLERPSLVRQQIPDFVDVAFVDTSSVATVGYLVHTASCLIPDFDPYNHIVNTTLGDPAIEDDVYCNSSWPMLTEILNGSTIRINSTLRDLLQVSYCEYQQVGNELHNMSCVCIENRIMESVSMI